MTNTLTDHDDPYHMEIEDEGGINSLGWSKKGDDLLKVDDVKIAHHAKSPRPDGPGVIDMKKYFPFEGSRPSVKKLSQEGKCVIF